MKELRRPYPWDLAAVLLSVCKPLQEFTVPRLLVELPRTLCIQLSGQGLPATVGINVRLGDAWAFDVLELLGSDVARV